LEYDMTATSVWIVDRKNREAHTTEKCAIKRIPGARNIELRCLDLPMGQLNLRVSPVVLRSKTNIDNIGSIGLIGRVMLALNGKTQVATVVGAPSDRGDDSRTTYSSTDRDGGTPQQISSARPEHMTTQALPSYSLISGSSDGTVRRKPYDECESADEKLSPIYRHRSRTFDLNTEDVDRFETLAKLCGTVTGYFQFEVSWTWAQVQAYSLDGLTRTGNLILQIVFPQAHSTAMIDIYSEPTCPTSLDFHLAEGEYDIAIDASSTQYLMLIADPNIYEGRYY